MKITPVDPLEWLYPDRLNEVKPLKNKVFDVPRGGTFSASVVVSGLTPGKSVAFASNLPGCRVFEQIDVCVNANTGENGFAECDWSPKSHWITRDAPFRVFDALKPLAGEFTPTKETLALYLVYPVKHSAPAEKITLELSFSGGGVAAFDIQVRPTRIPEAGEKSFSYTNWCSFGNIADYSGVAKFSAAWWRLFAEHAAMMHHARQNTMLIPLPAVFSCENGIFTLDRARLRRIVRICTDAGLYWLEGGHFGQRVHGEWGAKDFNVMLTEHSVRSVEGNRDIASIACQLRDEIRKNGWGKRWIQHVTDEPIACNADSYRIFVGVVRKYLPGIPIVDATCDTDIAGSVDIWCPQVQEFQKHRTQFDAVRKQGDRVWAYTCCNPGGKFLNRLLDGELVRPLLLGWGCASCGIEGFLHWGWNFYKYAQEGCEEKPYQNLFELTTPLHGGTNRLPGGDTNIVYPGPHGEVWPSLRLEAQREGLEDLELIRLLQKKDPAAARKITSGVFRAFDDYTTDPAKIRKARKALLDALEKTSASPERAS